MSELTPCNRCTLERMRRAARQRGADVVVETVPPPDEMAGWISVQYTDDTEPRTYFKALSDECVC